MKALKEFIAFLIFCLCIGVIGAAAQTTEFAYQGKLLDGAIPPTANYDFEFRLFSVETGGAAIVSNQRLGVAVSNGVFSVRLNFGAQFSGANRFLEIAVKPAGSPNPLTVLTPRQPVSSTPYAIRSLNSQAADTSTNSQQLGGVAANQFVITTDTRLSDARDPLPNSANYIQNTNLTQAASNFNISGDGTANIFNAATQFNIGGSRVLATSSFFGNFFAGIGAGSAITSGSSNSFFGNQAGQSNVTGGANSFFGKSAGNSNTSGGNNSFFGEQSGFGNSSGADNSFFGQFSGRNNQTGSDNAFFGYRAGQNNTASGNSFFGSGAGDSVTSGQFNAFFGTSAGAAVITALQNSFFGYNAGLVNTGSLNSFFGALSGDSNTSGARNAFFGNAAGTTNVSGNDNAFFGHIAGSDNNTGSGNSFFGTNAGSNTTSGSNNTIIGSNAGQFNVVGSNNTIIGGGADLSFLTDLNFATAIGAGSFVSSSNTIALGRSDGSDKVVIYGLGGAGSTALCRNASNQIATCSSSLRYKTNVQDLTRGLNLIRRLRPITFDWKESGLPDVGFAAEEVNEIAPILTTRNDKGEIEGVKYAQISTVLVNAVNEQQTQIEAQQKQIEAQKELLIEQQRQLDALKKFICSQNPNAEICREQQL